MKRARKGQNEAGSERGRERREDADGGGRERGREGARGAREERGRESGSKGAREGEKFHGRYPEEDTGQYTVYSAQNNPQRVPCACA